LNLKKNVMAGEAKVTTDHEVIKKWAEERKGMPASVGNTGGKGGAGLLRIDYPGRRGKGTLNPISWEDFFQKFDEKELALLYQDKTAGGKVSRFSKLIKRENAPKSKAVGGNRASVKNREGSSGRARSKKKV
jgi:hypothetical protein